MLSDHAEADLITDVEATINQYRYVALGYGGTAATLGDTDLESEWAAVKYSDGATRENIGAWSHDGNMWVNDIDVDWVSARYTIFREIGIFDSDVIGAGNMLMRVIMSPQLNTNATRTYTITVTFIVAARDAQ